MIDHISIGVADLMASTSFYDSVLEPVGMKRLVTRDSTVGFGKQYPEFWLNHRPDMPAVEEATGVHVCLRARSIDAVHAFYDTARRLGAADDGAPGPRPQYSEAYYAAFIRDPDGNRIEVVTFIPKDAA